MINKQDKALTLPAMAVRNPFSGRLGRIQSLESRTTFVKESQSLFLSAKFDPSKKFQL